jgi:hypothetical protein
MIAFDRHGRLLSEDVIDPASFIDTDKAWWKPENGKAIYDKNCASCHGADGTVINFDDAAARCMGPKSLDNPWEVVHKARYGIPGEMPALAAVTNEIQEYIDLLAYAQTLPAVSPAVSWRAPMIIDQRKRRIRYDGGPPLWATQTTNTRTGNDTRRARNATLGLPG